MNNFIPLLRSSFRFESFRTAHRSHPALASHTGSVFSSKSLQAVFLFLFAFSFVQPTAKAQTTVFEETFSTEQWISRPNGTSGIWHLEGISGTGSPMAFGSTIAGDGTNEDSAYYAYYKNEFQLVSNRTYRISVRCSLAANAGTKEVVLALGPDLSHARRSTAQMVLQTGSLTTNGWNTFTATFNTTGDLSSWTQAVPVLWANVLGTPRTAMVYVDDVKIEQLSNLPPETVTILTPASWALVNSPANIKVTAIDPDNNIERIKFYSGTTYLGEVLPVSNILATTQTSYNFSTNLAPGTRSVKAVAIDQYGLSLESATRTFVINTPPTALSTSPANGTVYSTGPVELVATAADEDFNLVQVEFYVNGQKVGHTNTAPYSFRYYNTAGGQFTWYARAVDQLDSWGVSADRSFTIGALPTTSIISPQNHGTIGSCNVYIQAETTYGPGGILAMNFYRNDTLIGTDSISPYEYKGSGWAPGEYNIEARGVDLQGNDIEGAQIGIVVEAADLVLDLTETNQDCKYRIQGTLAPYQKLVISGLPMARRNDGSQFTGLGLVTGKEEKEWSEILIFEDFSPVGLGYTLTNAYGCSFSGTFPLHPEANEPPSIESELVLVSGLKLDPNTGEYYYCEPDAANLVIQPVVANTTGTFWYQALNPADNSQIYQTFTNGTVQITSPMQEEQQLFLNAVTPLGCTGGHPLTINFSGRQAPVVTVDPLISYGGQPAIGKAHASGGTAPYTFSWTGVDTCLTPNCDSVRLIDLLAIPIVTANDVNGCNTITSQEIDFDFSVTKVTNWGSSQVINGNVISGPNKFCSNFSASIDHYFEITHYRNGIQIDSLTDSLGCFREIFLNNDDIIYFKLCIGNKKITKYFVSLNNQSCGTRPNTVVSNSLNQTQFTVNTDILPDIIEIPVVITILTGDNASTSGISREQINSQIEVLNNAFNGSILQTFINSHNTPNCPEDLDLADITGNQTFFDGSSTYGFYQKAWNIFHEGEKMPIFRFYLPEEGILLYDRCGLPINPVRYINYGEVLRYNRAQEDFSNYNFIDESHGGIKPIDPERFLNIYVGQVFCNNPSDPEYRCLKGMYCGRFPEFYDDFFDLCDNLSHDREIVVVDDRFFGNNIGTSSLNLWPRNPDFNGLTAVHEVGHFLGLYHPTGNCGLETDGCRDTGPTNENSLQYQEPFDNLGDITCPCEEKNYVCEPISNPPRFLVRNFNFMHNPNHCGYYFTMDQAIRMYHSVSQNRRRGRIWLPKPSSPLVPSFDIVVNSCSGNVSFNYTNVQGCGQAIFMAPLATTKTMNPQVGIGHCSSAYSLSGSAYYSTPGEYSVTLTLVRDDGSSVIVEKSFVILGTGSSVSISNVLNISPAMPICEGQNLSLSLPTFYDSQGDEMICTWKLFSYSNSFSIRTGYSIELSSSELATIASVQISIPNPCGGQNLVYSLPIQKAPNIVLSAPTFEVCHGSCGISLVASPSGGSWSGPGVSQDPGSCPLQGPIFSPIGLTTGTHFLTYTLIDQFGCIHIKDDIQASVFEFAFSVMPALKYQIGNSNPISFNSPGTIGITDCQIAKLLCSYPGLSLAPVATFRVHRISGPTAVPDFYSTSPVSFPLLSEGTYYFSIKAVGITNQCEGPEILLTINVTGSDQIEDLELNPICSGESFGIQVLPAPTDFNSFAVIQGNVGVPVISDALINILLYSEEGYSFPEDGSNFKVVYQAEDGCHKSAPFQILGKPEPNSDPTLPPTPPVYVELNIERLAFVHSNIHLSGQSFVQANAKVFNRGQFDNADFDGTNSPTVNEVGWIVDGKFPTSLTLQSNCLVTAGCDRMWKGIELRGEGTDDLPLVINEGATVSNAFKAVELSMQHGKVRINATRASFLSNFTSLHIAQNDLNNNTLTECHFESIADGLLNPFVSTDDQLVTSRFGINLEKGNGGWNSILPSPGEIMISGCTFSNLLIGIHSYAGRFQVVDSKFDKIRYKGISVDNSPYDNPLPSVVHCEFNFNATPHTGWARTTTNYCCGEQNTVAGQEELPIGYLGKGLYGITSFVPLSKVINNSFTKSINLPFDRPVVGLLEPANSQARTGNTFTEMNYGILVPQGSLGTFKYKVNANTFVNNDFGIYVAGGNLAFEVKENTFIDNDFGIYLNGGTLNMGFNCNQFKLSCMSSYAGELIEDQNHPCAEQSYRVGLYVGPDVNLNDIGGITQTNPPAGNIWPVGNKSSGDIATSSFMLTGWEHLPSFTCLVNETSNLDGLGWKYYSFQNEFFNYLDYTQNQVFDPQPQTLIASTPNQYIPPNTDLSLVMPVCSNFSTIVFPVFSRPGGSDSDITAYKVGLQLNGAALGQNIPNPANLTTTIPFYIPQGSMRGRLEIFELGTGRVLKQYEILETGKGSFEVETRQLPVGIFGYRLLVDGEPIAYLKMVITH